VPASARALPVAEPHERLFCPARRDLEQSRKVFKKQKIENTHNPVFLCVSATLRDPFFTPRDFPKSKAEVEISKPISLGN
jgi:hypothetical protein